MPIVTRFADCSLDYLEAGFDAECGRSKTGYGQDLFGTNPKVL